MPRKPSLKRLRIKTKRTVEVPETLAGAARAADISVTTLFEAERGRRNLSEQVLRKLARVYNVSTDDVAAALEVSKREAQ